MQAQLRQYVFTDAVAYLLTFRRLLNRQHPDMKALPFTKGRAAVAADTDFLTSQKMLLRDADAVDWDKIPTTPQPWDDFYTWLLDSLVALADAAAAGQGTAALAAIKKLNIENASNHQRWLAWQTHASVLLRQTAALRRDVDRRLMEFWAAKLTESLPKIKEA
jgi:hypothetical protein